MIWPIPTQQINGFVLWCKNQKSISPATTKAYIFALSKIQQMKGLNRIQFKNTLAEIFLHGWENRTPKIGKTKQRMTLPTLKKIKNSIKRHCNSKLDYFAAWTACCTAFFASARMGEILAKSKFNFDPTSTLLWKDVKIFKNKIVLKIKLPKTTLSFPVCKQKTLPGHCN
jgi:hypothetical protein